MQSTQNYIKSIQPTEYKHTLHVGQMFGVALYTWVYHMDIHA